MISTLDIVFKITLFSFFKRHLIIGSNHIEYQGTSIAFSEVTHLNYGILQLYINGIKANRTYTIELLTNDPNRSITITFQTIGLLKRWYAPKESLYLEIILRLTPVTKRLANIPPNKLQREGHLELANLKMTKEGAELKKGFFKKTTEIIPWVNCHMGVGSGKIHMNSADNKFKKTIRILRTMDAVVLQCLLEHLWENGKVLALSRGEKIESIE